MEPREEVDLVRRAQAGDRAAFEDLIRATARLVWASVYGWVRDPAWTEDLVQDTFLKAWEAVRELKQPEAFRGWLLTIARRLAWRQAEVGGRTDLMAAVPEKPAPVDAADPERRARRCRRRSRGCRSGTGCRSRSISSTAWSTGRSKRSPG
jgi:RNA polymerase sigma factor (sigma-70 family)